MVSDFQLRFWGTRGSIATPGADKSRYGGNTTCVEMVVGDERLIFDAGTGIRELGNLMMQECPDGGHASLFFSHTHWDHIQGFPFFGPAYHPAFSLHIYGNAASRANVRDLLHGQMQQAYFPVPFEALQGGIEFREMLESGLTVGNARISAMSGVHPGGVTIYRVDYRGRAAVFCTDVELDLMLLHGGPTKPNEGLVFPPDLLRFLHAVDVLVVDCQYTDELYLKRRNWGHPSLGTVVDLAAQTQVGRVFLTHHDPDHNDEQISAMVDDAALRLSMISPQGLVHGAREGLVVAVDL